MDKYKEACEAAERGEPQFDEEGFPLEGSKAWFDESRNELLEMGWW